MTSANLLAAMMLLTLGASPIRAAEIAPEEAGKHAGETATVCGVVASARFSERSKSQPTFLNLGRPYPNQVFTVVIFGRDRVKFGTPESTLLRKRICVTGPITLFQGRPETVISEPSQLSQ